MRRPILTLAAFAMTGVLFTAGEASACHKKKACTCAPAPVVCAPPVVETCAPAPKKHCGMGLKMPKLGHHKKAVACETPMTYAYAPVHATGQMVMPSGQAMPSMQK